MRLERRELGAWELRELGGPLGPFPAPVPGDVHEALLAADIIPDPRYGLNELEVQWLGERDWSYRCTFELSEEEAARPLIDLCAPGVDTFCTVLLNGAVVGESSNMFVPLQLSLAGKVRSGHNDLELRFDSAVRRARELEALHGVRPTWNGPGERLYVRKAQYHWSWDWGPTLVTAGLPFGLWLELGEARLPDVQLWAELRENGEGTVHLVSSQEIQIELCDPQGKPVTSAYGSDLHLPIPDPELWWPNGHGEQPLYQAVLRLLDQHGNVLDEQQRRLGLRRIELRRDPLEDGETFAFRVNGRTMFMTGANWIPDDTQLARVTPERLRSRLTLARDAHFTMLRVWGGGIYEPDAFYDLCDEFGLLVWQDFMFACGLYPASPEFRESVRTEARAQVSRLAHHPCLAVLCGNNEDHQVAEAQGYRTDGSDPQFEAWVIYHQDLPEVAGDLAPHVLYWPASPWTPDGQPGQAQASDPGSGDRHAWEVWHGPIDAYQNYSQYAGRFVSEFGLASGPLAHTIPDFVPPDERSVHSRTLDHHLKAAGGVRRLATYIAENLPWPENLSQWLYATQLVQAEAMAEALRQWRRRFVSEAQPLSAGALVWQLNDCWPALSWAVTDYCGEAKPALHALARASAPLMVGIERPGFHPGGGQTLHAATEQQATVFVSALIPPPPGTRLDWQLWTLAGQRVSEGSQPVAMATIGSRDQLSLDVPWGAVLRVQWLAADGTLLAEHSAWPEPHKHFPHQLPNLRWDGDALRTPVPVKGAWLNARLPLGVNAVDLFPDTPWPVAGAQPWEKAWTVSSLAGMVQVKDD